MGKKDRLRRGFKRLVLGSHSSTNSASITSGTSVTSLEARLNEPANGADRASLTGNRSQDAPFRDLWGLALGKLSSEDKETVSLIISDSKIDILRSLRSEVVKKQIACEDRRWKFELNGHQIVLREVAEKIIFWIDKFKEIGDIAVNFDPVHASLPWAGMRFLLEVGSIMTLKEIKADD